MSSLSTIRGMITMLVLLMSVALVVAGCSPPQHRGPRELRLATTTSYLRFQTAGMPSARFRGGV